MHGPRCRRAKRFQILRKQLRTRGVEFDILTDGAVKRGDPLQKTRVPSDVQLLIGDRGERRRLVKALMNVASCLA